MKIYTKQGDKGMTSLAGGNRVPKYHLRLDAYGTVDELNAYIGLLRDMHDDKTVCNTLLDIQNRLLLIGSLLADEKQMFTKSLPELTTQNVKTLEIAMDRMNNHLPELKSFVIPGGDILVSYSHISRCICRRCERLCVKLHKETAINLIIFKYLNRLSDYLFVLARYTSYIKGREEIFWNPLL